MNDQEAIRNSQQLESYLEVREQKFQRNYDRYFSNGYRRDSIYNLYGQPLSYYFQAMEEDSGTIPVLNGIKNAVDTVVSKFASQKVRPFVNPVDGTYETRKVCRELQVALDHLYDTQKVYQKTPMVLRDALLMEAGHHWVDDIDKEIKIVRPWEVFYDPAQMHYGKMTVLKLRFRQYPVAALVARGWIKKSDPLYAGYANNPLAVVNYSIHYDLESQTRRDIVNSRIIHKSDYHGKKLPVTFLYYNPPVKGCFTTSLADDLFTIQTQVDTIAFRIHAAVELSPANTIFIPKGSGLKASMISNQIGSVYETTPTPNGTLPVTVSTPRPIDPGYVNLLDYFLDKMLSMSGISKMSAQAQKPKGDTSGHALDTLEDVESERWNLVLNNVIQSYMDLKDIWIDIQADSDLILPKESGRASVTYGEVKKQMAKMHIQFSAASNLSKDPKTKLEQIYILDQMGLVNPSQKAALMEMPDLEGAYSVATASYENCQSIITRAVEDEDYDFYPVVDLKQLFGEVQNAILRFDSAGDDKKILDRLVKLLKTVDKKMGEVNRVGAPHPLPMGQGPVGPNGMPQPGAQGPMPPAPVMPGQQHPINVGVPAQQPTPKPLISQAAPPPQGVMNG